jgi:predicted dinucleotide-binding enzyme
MQIGIIGSGMIGGTLARRFAAAGHDVTIGNSRGPESLTGLVAEIGERARAGTADDAARAGEVVVVAIPAGRYRELPAEALAGRIVVDANNYYPGRDGAMPELDSGTTTSSELLAASLPGARVVKAFNTIYFEHLRDQGTPPGTPGRRALPIAGDDPDAKRTVAALIDDIGFDTVDLGPLAEGRRQEPGTPVYNVALTRDELAAALG